MNPTVLPSLAVGKIIEQTALFDSDMTTGLGKKKKIKLWMQTF